MRVVRDFMLKEKAANPTDIPFLMDVNYQKMTIKEKKSVFCATTSFFLNKITLN